MENILYISFQLLGTAILPKEISQMTAIRPDTELMKGERNPKLMLPRLNIWSVQSKVRSDEVADHWQELEMRLTGAKDSIREIARTGQAKLTIVVKGGQRIPSIIIPSSMSAFAGFVNAIIDIDHLQS